ncbi:MAG: sirohydrochlorin chelatase [Chloroflexota bacterium]
MESFPKQLVLVLGHGSQRSSATNEGIREVARRLQACFPQGPVIRPAFFEFLSPSLKEAILAATEQGCREIAILPYFLFDGKEIQRDIPLELDHLRAALPAVRITQLSNLGLDPRLAQLVAQRVGAALLGTSQYLPAHGLVRRGAGGRLGVVVVNRGSRARWDSGERLEGLAALVRDEIGSDTLVEVAQAENSTRTIETASDALVARGARRIVIAPYLHFIGKVMSKDVVPALERSRAGHPEVQFCLAWTLCVNDTAIAILSERVRATGFEGAPQA